MKKKKTVTESSEIWPVWVFLLVVSAQHFHRFHSTSNQPIKTKTGAGEPWLKINPGKHSLSASSISLHYEGCHLSCLHPLYVNPCQCQSLMVPPPSARPGEIQLDWKPINHAEYQAVIGFGRHWPFDFCSVSMKVDLKYDCCGRTALRLCLTCVRVLKQSQRWPMSDLS